MDGKGFAVSLVLFSRFRHRFFKLYPGGQAYQGSFRMGLREGRGSVTFTEGAIYEGRFRDDRIDGQGTLHISSVMPGAEDGEHLIPVQIQADLKRIHTRAGFGDDLHH